jgi:hypothetical protein
MKFETILNEITEEQLIKKAQHVFQFLKKGTFTYIIPNGFATDTIDKVKIEYELPDNVQYRLTPRKKSVIIEFEDSVKYRLVSDPSGWAESHWDDEDDYPIEDFMEKIIKKFVKYRIILIDLNYWGYGDDDTEEDKLFPNNVDEGRGPRGNSNEDKANRRVGNIYKFLNNRRLVFKDNQFDNNEMIIDYQLPEKYDIDRNINGDPLIWFRGDIVIKDYKFNLTRQRLIKEKLKDFLKIQFGKHHIFYSTICVTIKFVRDNDLTQS